MNLSEVILLKFYKPSMKLLIAIFHSSSISTAKIWK